MSMEGMNTADKHTITLPNGKAMAITGTLKGTIERPTLVGTDDEGRRVEAVYDTVNGKLEIVSLTIDGEDQMAEEMDMAA